MLDPEEILVLQGFAYGIAQNLISTAIVEWKKRKDDTKALETAMLLENHEHSKPLEERIGQRICQALRNLNLSKQAFSLILPLASDAVIGGELARQILEDKYASDDIAKLINRCSPSSESMGIDVRQIASLLVGAIQSAIAEDPHLHRTKELQFQARMTLQVAEVKGDTSKTYDAVRQSTQVVIEEVSKKIDAGFKSLSDNKGELENRDKIYHDRVEQARELLESDQPKTARRILEKLRQETAKLDVSKSLLIRIATNIGCCAIQLDDNETAIREIDFAYQLDPDNPKSIANLAAISLLKGKPHEALELAGRARELTPQNS
jgi:tetratricopeptide (TPR) repeat protein